MNTFDLWTCSHCGTVCPAAAVDCAVCGAALRSTPPGATVLAGGKPAPPMAPTFAPPAPVTGSTGRASATPSSWTTAPAHSGLFRTAPHGAVAHQQAPHPASDATRYLCAAVQSEGNLANKVIESVLKEPHRAIASSPGVDLVCVLRYALAARFRQTTALVLLALTMIGMVGAFVFQPLSDGSLHFPHGFHPLSQFASIVVFLLDPFLFPHPPLAFPLLAVAWVIVLVEQLITFYGVLRPKLGRATFDPAQAPHVRLQDEEVLRRLATEDRQGNVSVFSGYEPFVGYGRLLNNWNFTVPVDRPDKQYDDVRPFTLKALDAEVMTAVTTLGLPGVEIAERVFVSGADLAQGLDPALRPLLLPRPEDRPQIALDPAVLDRLRDDGVGRVRPYLVTSVSGWNSELVATTTVRFSLSPARDLLFVEGAMSLLLPLHRRHHQVDHLLDRPTGWQLFALLRSSARAAPFRLVAAPFRLAFMVWGQLTEKHKYRKQRRQIALGAFDYGAKLSLRETASDSRFHRYFQQIDSQMYLKIVERRVLDTLTDFLADHQVDISDLRERQNVIYNGGVFASGDATVNFVDSPVAAGAASRIMTRVGLASTGGRGQDR
ncbi:zinc finger Ran-binding domain-containing protein [Kitasatospora sp. NPDC004723]|uniref:zinc finger Ran-binding domain-containing protein n=1 Tax=Kitasatospora sp. NPDC004723 TaxID=3154288 RepID=UPI0033A9B4BB